MSCLLRCKASFTPYLPQEQNLGMPFRAVFFMILFYDFFKDIYLNSFIRPFSPVHLLWKGQSLHTVLEHRYSFVTVLWNSVVPLFCAVLSGV